MNDVLKALGFQNQKGMGLGTEIQLAATKVSSAIPKIKIIISNVNSRKLQTFSPYRQSPVMPNPDVTPQHHIQKTASLFEAMVNHRVVFVSVTH